MSSNNESSVPNENEKKEAPNGAGRGLLGVVLQAKAQKDMPSLGERENKESDDKNGDPLAHPLLPETIEEPNMDDSESGGKHRRKVSWSLQPREVKSPSTSDVSSVKASSPTTPPSEGERKKITLSQVMKHCPYESEADALIQETLEELNVGDEPAGRTILGYVPADANPDAFDPNAGRGMSSADRGPSTRAKKELPLFEKKAHKKTKSTAEDLWALTNDLTKLHEKAKSNGLRSSSGTLSGSGSGDDSSANDLVRNAVNLMRRYKSDHNVDGSSQTSSTMTGTSEARPKEPEISAADRWKKLKVHVTTAHGAVKAFETAANDAKTPQEPDAENIDDDESKGSPKNDHEGSMFSSLRKSRGARAVKAGYKDFEDWVRFKKIGIFSYVKLVLLGLMIPGAGIAAILFYLAGNPPCNDVQCSRTKDSVVGFIEQASVSWWLLFICCRQAVTFTMARCTQAIVIDFMALRSKAMVKVCGPFATLFIVQSKGWPFTVCFWGIYDLILLYGENEFAKHWLFWQKPIHLFNANNPSGNVTSSQQYKIILITAVVLSFFAAIKRFWVGLFLGQRTFVSYSEDLARVMKNALLISQVGNLARDIESSDIDFEQFGLDIDKYVFEEDEMQVSARDVAPSRGLPSDFSFSSRRAKVDEILGAWEEPETRNDKKSKASLGAIIQFRQSVSYLNSNQPFSLSFGRTSTRQECVEASEAVYNRLLMGTPGASVLKFETLALLAVRRSGKLDEEKVKHLVKLFRPDREGNLTLLDFAKSVDSVYKELRLLRASVESSSRIDSAFEAIINVIFYFIVFCVVLYALGVDPLVLFASTSGFILSFAFMFGSAASKSFEGMLLILMRRPYDIGDRINVSSPTVDTPGTGSPGWIVKDVNLHTTTCILGATNEVCTYSNFSLAATRIINAARSPKANLNFLLKFQIDTPYAKLQLFKSAIEKFIKARPRDWISFLAFRPTRVEADLGFVEYIVVAQHRESWQNPGALLNSKAELSSFALELSKKMNMRYRSPPMPVDLNLKQNVDPNSLLTDTDRPDSLHQRTPTYGSTDEHAASTVAAMFGAELSPSPTSEPKSP